MAYTIGHIIGKLLRADITLKGLTGGTTPDYKIYMDFPYKKDIAPSLVSFKFIGSLRPSELRQDRFLAVTLWGDNYEAMGNAVYSILHLTSPATADERILLIKFINSGAELWDDGLQCYYRQDQYQIILAKE